MAYVTLERAKRQLNVIDDAFDATIDEKIEEASDIIGEYLGANADDTWDEWTTPPVVQSATLLMVTHLFEHRGEDPTLDEELWLAINRLLRRRRDPVLS